MQQLTLPGIESAPGQVRQHGLKEFHRYPLVSYGKDAAGGWTGSWRVPAERAWTYPELELGRTPNSIPALLFDLDGDPTDWLVDVFSPAVPLPNWITFRRANQHAHVVYTLAHSVLTGEQARPTPQAYLARAGEYLAATLHADAAYSAVLAHNPLARAPRGAEDPGGVVQCGRGAPRGWRGQPWTPRPRASDACRFLLSQDGLNCQDGDSWRGV